MRISLEQGAEEEPGNCSGGCRIDDILDGMTLEEQASLLAGADFLTTVPVECPDKELRAFAKLRLAPGETGTASLIVRPRDLSYFDEQAGAFRAAGGRYELLAGSNAADIRSAVTIELVREWIGDVSDRSI